MTHGEQLVYLLLRVLALLLEDALGEAAQHHEALGVLHRDARQPLTIKEGAQHPGVSGRGPVGQSPVRLRGAGLLPRDAVQAGTYLGQASQSERVVHVRRSSVRLDQSGLAQLL